MTIINKEFVKSVFEERADKWSNKHSYIQSIDGTSERLIQELSHLLKKDNLKVADFGCGTGKITKEILKLNNSSIVYSIDSSKAMVDNLMNNIEYDLKKQVVPIIADISNTELPDNECDIVVMQQVLHHVNQPLKVLEEIERILKKGGKFIILGLSDQYQANLFPYKECDMKNDLLGRCNEEGLLSLLNQAGLKPISIYKDNFAFSFDCFDSYFKFMDNIGVLPKMFNYEKVNEMLKKEYLLDRCKDIINREGMNIDCQYITILAKKVDNDV